MDKSKPPAMGTGEQNPKLEMAAKEIADILKKHDIAGIVQLYTPGFNKYTMNIAPSFSVVAVDEVGRLKITAPIVDSQNEEASKARILETVRMLANIRIYLGRLTMTMTQSEMAVRSFFKIAPPENGVNNLPFKN